MVYETVASSVLAAVDAVLAEDQGIREKAARQRLRPLQNEDDGEYTTKVTRDVFNWLKHGSVLRGRWGSAQSFAESVAAEVIVEPPLAAVHARAGRLVLTTVRHLERMRRKGKLLCPQCGVFFAERLGLRTHQQVAHKSTYATAKQVESSAKQQLILRPRELSLWGDAMDAAGEQQGSAGGSQGGEERGWEDLCRAGDAEGILELHARGGWTPRAADKHGSGALHWAAGSGQLAFCRLLVSRFGMDAAREQVKDGRTPLHWACRNGHVDVARWLVEEQGCDVDSRTLDGQTPFHWAVLFGRREVCEYLVGRGCDWRTLNGYACNAVQYAAMREDVAMCVYLRDLGLDLGLLNRNGHSALHKAANKGRLEVCQWLLGEGGLVPERHMLADMDGNTPSLMARFDGHTAVADYLEGIENGMSRSIPPDAPAVAEPLVQGGSVHALD